MRARGLRLVLSGAMLLGVGCDHATKHIATQTLRGAEAVELVPGVLDLRYAENRDVGFHLLSAIPEGPRQVLMLVFGSVAVTLMLALWLGRRIVDPWQQAGLALLLCGALGNLLDRLFRGYVVDFIHVHHWPVFNVADVCICAGAALLVLGVRRTAAASA